MDGVKVDAQLGSTLMAAANHNQGSLLSAVLNLDCFSGGPVLLPIIGFRTCFAFREKTYERFDKCCAIGFLFFPV